MRQLIHIIKIFKMKSEQHSPVEFTSNLEEIYIDSQQEQLLELVKDVVDGKKT
jgi:hypothetical protein